MGGGASLGPNAMWMGCLDSIDDYKVYGYRTSTRITFLAALKDVEDGNKQLMRESGLKALFVSVLQFV